MSAVAVEAPRTSTGAGRATLGGCVRGTVQALLVAACGLGFSGVLGVAFGDDLQQAVHGLAMWPVLQLAAAGGTGGGLTVAPELTLGLQTGAIPLGWTGLAAMTGLLTLRRFARTRTWLVGAVGHLAGWAVAHTAVTVAGVALIRAGTDTRVELDAAATFTGALVVGLLVVGLRVLVDLDTAMRPVRRLRAQLFGGARTAALVAAGCGAALLVLAVVQARTDRDALLLAVTMPLFAGNWMVLGMHGLLGGAIAMPVAPQDARPVLVPEGSLPGLVADALGVPDAVPVAVVVFLLVLLVGREALRVGRLLPWRSLLDVIIDVAGVLIGLLAVLAVAGAVGSLSLRLAWVPAVDGAPIRTLDAVSDATVAIPVAVGVGVLTAVVLCVIAARALRLGWVAAPAEASPAPSQPPPKTSRCAACGTALRPGARFCAGCGQPVAAEPVTGRR